MTSRAPHPHPARRPVRATLAGLAVLAVVVAPHAAPAQTFTRVTDPANPVVNDTKMSCGATWVDLVGDGQLDLFVANGNLTSQPNALYRNDRAGGFVRVATGPLVTDGGPSIGATLADYDGDGLVDIFVPNRNSFGNFLYRGLGDTTFVRVPGPGPGGEAANSNSASWVDLDGDGALDLYVVNFQGNDFLYRNAGGPSYAFTRIDTTALTSGTEFSIPGAWADFNGDGLPDAFIGNAGTQNDYLYTNHGGLFFTRAVIADGLNTLGASWGDYDNDGWLDLIVAHYVNQAPTLYHNSGPPLFQLVPVDTSGVSHTVGNWVGTAWGDFDNDGYLDLFVANDGAPSALWHNDGPPGYGFTRVTTGPIATDVGAYFGAVWGDYDRDGQLDLLAVDHNGGKNHLYHNGGTANHWLTVRCLGAAPNTSAVGAKVRVFATIAGQPVTQLREVTAQTGYNSGNLDQHFGLGDAAGIDSLRIDWPGGARDEWAALDADRFVKLAQGQGTVGVGDPGAGSGLSRLSLAEPAPNPTRGAAVVRFDLAAPGRARIDLLDLAGRRVATLLDADLPAGPGQATLRLPRGAGAGVYFCRLVAGGATRVRKVVVVR